MTPDHTERSTLAACVAHVAGAPAGDVPLEPEEQRAWPAERARPRARGGAIRVGDQLTPVTVP